MTLAVSPELRGALWERRGTLPRAVAANRGGPPPAALPPGRQFGTQPVLILAAAAPPSGASRLGEAAVDSGSLRSRAESMDIFGPTACTEPAE